MTERIVEVRAISEYWEEVFAQLRETGKVLLVADDQETLVRLVDD